MLNLPLVRGRHFMVEAQLRFVLFTALNNTRLRVFHPAYGYSTYSLI